MPAKSKKQDTMLTANRLEKIMELEQELRAEYQQQLDDKQAAIDAALAEKADLQATIDKQLETIQELTGKASDTQKVEQRNRELHNRADNLQGEIAELKQRLKTLQKDLNAVREENGFTPVFADTSKKPDTGQKECRYGQEKEVQLGVQARRCKASTAAKCELRTGGSRAGHRG